MTPGRSAAAAAVVGVVLSLAGCGGAGPGADTTTGPTGDPGSTSWTDDRMRDAEPEDMPAG